MSRAAKDWDGTPASLAPEPTQRFDQQYARVEPAPGDLNGRTLIGQGDAVRGQHLQVPERTALIALHRQIQLMLCGVDRPLLCRRLVGENAQRCKVVLDLLE